MIYLDHRDSFLSKEKGYDIDNPEILKNKGYSYYFLIDNECMNEPEFVRDIIKQAKLEGIHFIVLFEDTDKLQNEFDNLLIKTIIEDNYDMLLRLCFLNPKTDRYEYFHVAITQEGKVQCINLHL